MFEEWFTTFEKSLYPSATCDKMLKSVVKVNQDWWSWWWANFFTLPTWDVYEQMTARMYALEKRQGEHEQRLMGLGV